MRIAVTSGYAHSRHAVALVSLLHRARHEVGLCLNVRVLGPARLRSYWRLHGADLFSLFRRRILDSRKDAAALHPEQRYIEVFLERQGVPYRTVARACQAAGARLVNVADLNGPAALDALDRFAPDLIVYAGGGLLRQPFLDRARIGVLNAHGGPLPRIRGMNAAEWALLEGLQPGVTVHFIDRGVDTGPVLLFRPLEVARGDAVADVRGKSVVLSVEALLEAVEGVAAGRLRPTPQAPEEGRQYFKMHPVLIEIVEAWIRLGRTPAAAREGAAP